MSSRGANFSMGQPGVVAGNFALSFLSTFWAFLCISKAPFGRSFWSGHYWKDLFLLQKLSIDDANFGQKRWGQKWKKGQGSSWVVAGSTGVNGLKRLFFVFCFTECSVRCHVLVNWRKEFASLEEAEAALGLTVESYLDSTPSQVSASDGPSNEALKLSPSLTGKLSKRNIL